MKEKRMVIPIGDFNIFCKGNYSSEGASSSAHGLFSIIQSDAYRYLGNYKNIKKCSLPRQQFVILVIV
jgi:hypothetical protein